ncbi:NAD(P)/FAD-dependent oxidoreductase, partial [Achromobacter ruhlandii]|nr:NAD(P)/FAD-dependent oxidoreductase [Achromobacter ruhlandii]
MLDRVSLAIHPGGGVARLGLAPLLVEASGRLGGLAVDNPFADDWIAVLPGMTGQQ